MLLGENGCWSLLGPKGLMWSLIGKVPITVFAYTQLGCQTHSDLTNVAFAFF